MKPFYILLLSIIITLPLNCKKETEKQENVLNSITPLFVTAKAGLKLREQADQNAKLMILIPHGSEVKLIEEKGDTITISDKSGKWTKIEWKEYSGWAFGGFLSKTKPPDNVIYLSDLSCGKIISKSERYCWPANIDSIKKMNYQEAKEYCGSSGLPSKQDFMTAGNNYQGGFWTSDETDDGIRVKIFALEVYGDGGGGISEMTSDKDSKNYAVCK